MKNGIEVRKNGNRILKRGKFGNAGFFGYTVEILKSDGSFKESVNNPWDYLSNAREDADSMNVKEEIIKCNRAIEHITAKLNRKYVPAMRKCNTMAELIEEWDSILRDIGVESSDEIPGTFHLEIHFQMDRVRQLENINA